MGGRKYAVKTPKWEPTTFDKFKTAFMDWKSITFPLSALVVAGVAYVAVKKIKNYKNRVKQNTVLELELDGKEVYEAKGTSVEDRLMETLEKPIFLQSVIQTLSVAEKDNNVKALVVYLGGDVQLGWAQAEELRAALERFKNAGKHVVAYAESFGEASPSHISYYIACGCSSIIVSPAGSVGVVGIAVGKKFFKGMLEKVGVELEIAKRKEYKTAPNMFTEEKFTEEDKEVMEAIQNKIEAHFLQGVQQGRREKFLELGICEEGDDDDIKALSDILNDGPFSAKEGVERGLIDKILYHDELLTDLKTSYPNMNLLYLSAYTEKVATRVKKEKHRFAKKGKIGVIVAEGMILTGPSKSRFDGGPTIGSKTITKAFKQAVKDKEVKIIIFRINSGGGSALASDLIWREVCLAEQAGKKVIVSMSNLAASGGYYISCPASSILCCSTTLTGSIGAFSGKFVISSLLDKIGVSSDHIRGPHENSLYFSSVEKYGDRGRHALERSLDAIYDTFVAKVGEGRKMEAEEAEELARGRVWMGSEAQENGLADEIGGFHDALVIAKKELGIPIDCLPCCKQFPEEVGLLASILEKPQNSEDAIGGSGKKSSVGTLVGLLKNLSVVYTFITSFSSLGSTALYSPALSENNVI